MRGEQQGRSREECKFKLRAVEAKEDRIHSRPSATGTFGGLLLALPMDVRNWKRELSNDCFSFCVLFFFVLSDLSTLF